MEKRLQNIDQLYENIKTMGYKTQEDLRKNNNNIFFKNKFLPSELNEIRVSIDRHGNYIMEDGFHRLYIAQILKIKKIPVRVLVRHHLWQKKRDYYYKNKDENPPEHEDLVW